MAAAALKKESDKVRNRTCGSLHITKENKKENKPKRNIRAGAVTRQPSSCSEETSYQLLQRESKASAVKRQCRIAAAKKRQRRSTCKCDSQSKQKLLSSSVIILWLLCEFLIFSCFILTIHLPAHPLPQSYT